MYISVQNAYEYAATCVFVIVLAIVYEWLSDFRGLFFSIGEKSFFFFSFVTTNYFFLAYFNTKKSYDDGDDQTSLIQQ